MIADFLKVSRIFIFFGPVAYFRSSERSAAGWANILTFSDRAFFPSLDRPHRTAAVIASKGFGTLHRSPSFFRSAFFLFSFDHLLERLEVLDQLFRGIPHFRISASGKNALHRPDRAFQIDLLDRMDDVLVHVSSCSKQLFLTVCVLRDLFPQPADDLHGRLRIQPGSIGGKHIFPVDLLKL